MNKKFLLVAILMAMAIIAQAQSRKKKSKQKTSYALGISSGYFLHGDIFEESENTFSGYKTFQIDVQKYGKGVKSSIGLGFVSRKSEFTTLGTIIEESRNALFLNFNYLYHLKKNISSSGIYLGGFAGFLFDRGDQLPIVSFAFPISTTYLSFWTGPKAEYIYQVNAKISLLAGGQLGLLEFGRKTTKRDDPQLPPSAQSNHETYSGFAQRINLNLGFNIRL